MPWQLITAVTDRRKLPVRESQFAAQSHLHFWIFLECFTCSCLEQSCSSGVTFRYNMKKHESLFHELFPSHDSRHYHYYDSNLGLCFGIRNQLIRTLWKNFGQNDAARGFDEVFGKQVLLLNVWLWTFTFILYKSSSIWNGIVIADYLKRSHFLTMRIKNFLFFSKERMFRGETKFLSRLYFNFYMMNVEPNVLQNHQNFLCISISHNEM